MKRSIPAGSVEYVRYDVTGSADPQNGTVGIALVGTAATPASFVDGEWEGSTVEIEPGVFQATARFLVGQGDLDVVAGTYAVWVRVVAAPESFQRRMDDHITIT